MCEGQQGVIDGAEPRRDHYEEREPEIGSQRRHGVALPDWDKQPTRTLDDDEIGGLRDRSEAFVNKCGVDPLTGAPRGDIWCQGGVEPVRTSTLYFLATAGRLQKLQGIRWLELIATPSTPCLHRLHDTDSEATVAEDPAQAQTQRRSCQPPCQCR